MFGEHSCSDKYYKKLYWQLRTFVFSETWSGARVERGRKRERAGRPVMVSADEVDVNSQCNGERRDGGADRTESFVRGGGGET